MSKENLKSLADRTPEERTEIARKGQKASVEARNKKTMMSTIYAEFLMKEHDIIGKDGLKKKLKGDELLSSVMSKVLSRGDSASVSLMREIREATEGNKVQVDMNNPSDELVEKLNSLPIEELLSIAKRSMNIE
jgi:hypothetical protein